MISIVFILVFGLAAQAQTELLSAGSGGKKDSPAFHLNPLLRHSFKKPVKANPLLTEYIKPAKTELMRWPNYPLTPAQVAARDRKYDEPFGKQIAEEIIGSYINGILNGKNRKPVANIPKF